jgi:hypothetical protein
MQRARFASVEPGIGVFTGRADGCGTLCLMAADQPPPESAPGETAPARGRRIGGRRSGSERPRRRRVIGRRDPRLPSPVAAAAVGLLVAVLARVLIFGGERACDAVRGTSTCGSAGGFMLLAIAGLMVYAGTRLLRLLSVPEAAITSVLGVALLAILLLTVLVEQLFSVWMWVVLPAVAGAVYAFAAWAAARLSEVGNPS